MAARRGDFNAYMAFLYFSNGNIITGAPTQKRAARTRLVTRFFALRHPRRDACSGTKLRLREY